MQNLLPNDVKISYEFDQSVFVVNAVKELDNRRRFGCNTHRVNGTALFCATGEAV